MDFPTGPAFPIPNKFRQRFRIQFRSTEKMCVIGHNDVAANGPAVSIMSRAPFINKYFGDIVASENFPAILGARCYEINRRINPNAPKSSQMFVHVAVVAEGGETSAI
jgi:hypothetical protein